MRKTVIAGNWKMNMTPADTKAFIEALKPMVAGKDQCDIVLCVPFVDLATAILAAKGSNIKIGAENVHFKESGAYTGEISAVMLTEIGTEYVIIGHSERRQYFAETDATVNLRTKAALKAGLKVILCVGELLEAREAGITSEILSMQTKLDFAGIPEEDLKNIIIAYEPVWAIGTGKTATAQQANDTIRFIRKTLARKYGRIAANRVRIQYGGSMNPKNAAELMAMSDIDGGLIGGASLKADDFTAVIRAGSKN